MVDQHGDPVSGASVKVLIIDNESDESKPKMMLTSDADGRFSVKGIKGLAIDVVVKKESYLTKSDQGLAKPASSRLIAYGLDGSGGARFKDPDKPTLFTLHKLGPMEPLVYVTKRRWKLATDGTARNIALDTEKGLGSHQIEFQFTTDWAKIPKGSAAIYRKFDWKLEMRISGGGFCKSRSDYLFEAPDGGYEEKIRVNHPKDHSNWSTVDGGRYFVRFSDGTYGKIRFTIDGNSDFAPLMMTSWMNLKPGSRNLNSDKRDSNLMLDE
ncbi:MAG: carboxypeptidase-like regulatory domain-containing protein [Verrucomicrobiota bacterium]